jgi:hypothetical protein
MPDIVPPFNKKAVHPIECFRAGWALIKDRYWLITGVTCVGVIIAGLAPMGILAGPMMCGIYIVLFRCMRGQPIEFSLLFKGFDHFLESLIATLIKLVPVILLLIPLFAGVFGLIFFLTPHRGHAMGNPQVQFVDRVHLGREETIGLVIVIGLFLLVFLAIGMTIGVLFTFSYPLIVDRRLSGVDAVKTSIKAAIANFWGLMGLAVLTALLGIIGVVLCYFGVFLVLPVSLAAIAVAYRQVFGLPGAPIIPPPLAGSTPQPS